MKAVNVNDVLKILYKYGKYIFVTDEKRYSSMIDEIVNLKALKQESILEESILDKIKVEIKEWYWQADKQALAKDPCVVDAMIDLFIRTIDKYKAESES